MGKMSPEYNAWYNMHRRCADPAYHAAHRYSGRGIMVCIAWEQFATFLADMGCRPSSAHTLERENNDLGYSKCNCLWALRTAQARNRVSTKLTVNDVETIRAQYATGASSYDKLAAKFAVHRTQIRNIVLLRRWI